MKRVLTAAVLLPVFIACVLARNPAYFAAMVAVASLLCAWEYEQLCAASGIPRCPFLVCVLSLAFLGGALWPEVYGPSEVLLAGLVALMAWGLFARMDLKRFLAGVSASLFGAVYVGFMLGLVLRLHSSPDGKGPRLIFLACVVVWAGDTAAYYAGRAFGKRLLAPRVSPKKTWEGAFANAAAGVAAACIAKWTFFPELGWADAVVLGLLLTTVGQMGDLFESAIKRGADVKDSSGILPGHGGMLDRLDSLLFGGPVLYYYHQVVMA